MTEVVRRTGLLALALAVLLVLDVGMRMAGTGSDEALPSLSKVDPKQITRIVVSQGDGRLELEPDGLDGWRVVAPFESVADRAAVRAMYTKFFREVPVDLRVDTGNLKEYGLASPGAIRVEIEGGDQILSSFYVGRNAQTGGATFVRFPDSDEVYLARIGGRHRYDRPDGAWRDHTIFGLNPQHVLGVVMQPRDGEAVELFREPGKGEADQPGQWKLKGDASFSVDQELAQGLAQTLSQLRAGALLSPDHPGGLEDPDVLLTIAVQEGGPINASIRQHPSYALLRHDGRPEVFQIARGLVDRLEQPADTWCDRQFLRLDRASILRLTLHEPSGLTSVLEQDPATSQWRVTRPAGVDAEQRLAMGTARMLADFRVDDVGILSASEAGFPSDYRVDVELVGGVVSRLEIGNPVPDRQARYVRVVDQPDRVGVVSLKSLAVMRRAWAR